MNVIIGSLDVIHVLSVYCLIVCRHTHTRLLIEKLIGPLDASTYMYTGEIVVECLLSF